MRNFLTNMSQGLGDRCKDRESLVKHSWFRFFMPILMVVILLMPGGERNILDVMKPDGKSHE
ncbi:MAG: hypothetical protein LWW75_08585 [Chlorobiales bacterium]|nr:hypothetical protein [Chlorobiales bacterium]